MPRSKIVLAAHVIVGLYWVLLFVLTHLPIVPDKERPPVHTNVDKIAHCVAFAGLAFLLSAAGAARWGFHPLLFARVLFVVAAYGAFDEWSQGFIPLRDPDIHDWIADMLGAGIGLSAFSLIEPLLRSWAEPPASSEPAGDSVGSVA